MAQAIIEFPLDKDTGILFMEMLYLEEIVLQDSNTKTIIKQCRKVTEIASTLPQRNVEIAMEYYDRI